MRWDALFRDMEAQLAAAAESAEAGEVSERVRMELGRVTLQDRLRSQHGKQLALDLGAAGTVCGQLSHMGEGWVAVDTGRGPALAALAHVVSIRGLDRFSSTSDGAVRLGLASALRGIARDRSPVTLRCANVPATQALHGTIDRVGADFLELAAVAPGEARRSGSVSAVYVLPLSSIALVMPQPYG